MATNVNITGHPLRHSLFQTGDWKQLSHFTKTVGHRWKVSIDNIRRIHKLYIDWRLRQSSSFTPNSPNRRPAIEQEYDETASGLITVITVSSCYDVTAGNCISWRKLLNTFFSRPLAEDLQVRWLRVISCQCLQLIKRWPVPLDREEDSLPTPSDQTNFPMANHPTPRWP